MRLLVPLSISGLITNRHLRRRGNQSDRLRVLPSSACIRGSVLLSGRRRDREETVFAPVRRRSHGRALRRFAEGREVRDGRAPDAVYSSRTTYQTTFSDMPKWPQAI